MLYICTKVCENIVDYLQTIEPTPFCFLKITNGHNSVEDVDKTRVLTLRMLFICINFFLRISFTVLKVYSRYNSI